jgi:RluA family pseudouridine synthase
MSLNEIPVLFQNDEFVAVNKPAGISVHNNEDPTNLLLVLQEQLNLKKLFPVHRLDKETSGIQILALNESSAKTLAETFQSRKVEKIYSGVLKGKLDKPEGIWNQPLTDKAEGRRQPAGQSRDRIPCETRYRVLETNQYFVLCEFNLITGRQHQIRKHAAMVNHPLIGDSRYGDPKYNQKISEIYKNDRMFLHCARVVILGTTIECPTPADFALLLAPQ